MLKVDIIPIGNSKGIRIPKVLLEECGFGESVQIKVAKNQLVLIPVPKRRQGWDEAFKAMADNKDDKLIHTPPTAFDEDEW
jgi:antitoxin MazE